MTRQIVALSALKKAVQRGLGLGRVRQRLEAVVPTLRGEVISVAMRAASTAFEIDRCRQLSESQTGLAETIENASRETTAAIEHVATSVQHVAASSEDSLGRARSTAGELAQAAARIEEVDTKMQSFLRSVQEVYARCGQVQAVIEQIGSIAQKTKILALNAAIEAANAGPAGRGFAVVSREIQALADQVSAVTGETQSTVRIAVELAADAAGQTMEVREGIDATLEIVRRGRAACDGILADLEGASHQFSRIAAAAEQMSAANAQVMASIVKAKKASVDSAQKLRDTDRHSAALLASTERVQEVLGDFEIGSGHFERRLSECRRWRDRIEREVEVVARAGHDLFDKRYAPIAGTNPPQHAVAYQPAFEKAVRPLLDEARTSVGALACTCTASDGYLPTHNTDFSKPPTGDPAVDTRLCRDKRIMTDRHGQRSATYGGRLLLQTFVRDNGDLTAEIALPIKVDQRRWGAVRFGFAPQALAESDIAGTKPA